MLARQARSGPWNTPSVRRSARVRRRARSAANRWPAACGAPRRPPPRSRAPAARLLPHRRERPRSVDAPGCPSCTPRVTRARRAGRYPMWTAKRCDGHAAVRRRYSRGSSSGFSPRPVECLATSVWLRPPAGRRGPHSGGTAPGSHRIPVATRRAQISLVEGCRSQIRVGFAAQAELG